MFLLIQNPVKSNPDVELMATLGLSGSRGNDGRIGCFGSGFPYSLALLARHDLLERTKICLGTQVYTFSIDRKHAKTASGEYVDASTIVIKKQNGPSYPLNISVNFGQIDWRDVTLAIREFVSNCVDGVYEYGGTPSKDVVIRTDIPDEGRMTRAADGFIRVYIPLCDEIQTYIDNLHKYFRCLAPGYSAQREIILNVDNGPARIYRKGVLVGEFGKHSLFHYNINDIQINESRLVDSYTARQACAEAIARADVSVLTKYINSKLSGIPEGMFEKDLYVYTMKPDYIADAKLPEVRKNWADAISRSIGERIIASSDIATRMCESKGYDSVVVEDEFYNVLSDYGAKTPDSVLNAHEIDGKEIVEPTKAALIMVNFIWDKLVSLNLTMGKPRPNVKCFIQHIVDGAKLGYYRIAGDTIYLHKDYVDGVTTDGLNTVIHEIAHYITQSTDLSPEHANFGYKLAASLLMGELPNKS